MKNVENVEYGKFGVYCKCGVWKLKNVENAERRK